MPRVPFSERIKAPMPQPLKVDSPQSPSLVEQVHGDFWRNAKGTVSLSLILFFSFAHLLWQLALLLYFRQNRASDKGVAEWLRFWLKIAAVLAALLLLISQIYIARWLWSWRAAYQQRRSVIHWRVLLWTLSVLGAVEFCIGAIGTRYEPKLSFRGAPVWLAVLIASLLMLTANVACGLASFSLARVRNQDSPLVRLFMPFLPIRPFTTEPIPLEDRGGNKV